MRTKNTLQQTFDRITLVSTFDDFDFGRGLYLLAHGQNSQGRGTLLISQGENDGFYPDNGSDNDTIFEEQNRHSEQLTSSEIYDGIMSLPIGFAFSSMSEFYQGVKKAVESLPI